MGVAEHKFHGGRTEGPPSRCGRDRVGPDHPLLHPRPTLSMAEWKSSFERGISNFRLEKYEEALACFNEVRLPYPYFDEN